MKNYLRSFASRESFEQLVKVGLVGVVNTVVSLVIFRILLVLLGEEETRSSGFDAPLFAATVLSFAIATMISYMLNRRWTFKLDAATGTTGETAKFFALNAVALVVTTLVVNGANAIWGPLTDNAATVALVVAGGLIILPKFAGYRDVVFRQALRDRPNDHRADADRSLATDRD